MSNKTFSAVQVVAGWHAYARYPRWKCCIETIFNQFSCNQRTHIVTTAGSGASIHELVSAVHHFAFTRSNGGFSFAARFLFLFAHSRALLLPSISNIRRNLIRSNQPIDDRKLHASQNSSSYTFKGIDQNRPNKYFITCSVWRECVEHKKTHHNSLAAWVCVCVCISTDSVLKV